MLVIVLLLLSYILAWMFLSPPNLPAVATAWPLSDEEIWPEETECQV